MKYIISRTSQMCDDKEQPCEGAKKIILGKVKDIRWFKNKKEWLGKFPKDEKNALEWGITKEGCPYRIINQERIIWIIEIADLNKFADKYGPIILSSGDEELIGYEDLMQIEIYDSYRE